MTQRIFDVDNEKDMADLWNMLPDEVYKIENRFEDYGEYFFRGFKGEGHIDADLILIYWHNKTEITRPIQEATEADIGKLCMFWDNCCEDIIIGKLTVVGRNKGHTYYKLGGFTVFDHCRRLTKQEIEELC